MRPLQANNVSIESLTSYGLNRIKDYMKTIDNSTSFLWSPTSSVTFHGYTQVVKPDIYYFRISRHSFEYGDDRKTLSFED